MLEKDSEIGRQQNLPENLEDSFKLSSLLNLDGLGTMLNKVLLTVKGFKHELEVLQNEVRKNFDKEDFTSFCRKTDAKIKSIEDKIQVDEARLETSVGGNMIGEVVINHDQAIGELNYKLDEYAKLEDLNAAYEKLVDCIRNLHDKLKMEFSSAAETAKLWEAYKELQNQIVSVESLVGK